MVRRLGCWGVCWGQEGGNIVGNSTTDNLSPLSGLSPLQYTQTCANKVAGADLITHMGAQEACHGISVPLPGGSLQHPQFPHRLQLMPCWFHYIGRGRVVLDQAVICNPRLWQVYSEVGITYFSKSDSQVNVHMSFITEIFFFFFGIFYFNSVKDHEVFSPWYVCCFHFWKRIVLLGTWTER